MADGFKGRRLGITDVTFEGQFIKVTATFSDVEGIVHGYMKHQLQTAEYPEIQKASQELLEAISTAIERYHYDAPDTPSTTKEVKSGIAEALRGDPDSSNPVGSEDVD